MARPIHRPSNFWASCSITRHVTLGWCDPRWHPPSCINAASPGCARFRDCPSKNLALLDHPDYIYFQGYTSFVSVVTTLNVDGLSFIAKLPSGACPYGHSVDSDISNRFTAVSSRTVLAAATRVIAQHLV